MGQAVAVCTYMCWLHAAICVPLPSPLAPRGACRHTHSLGFLSAFLIPLQNKSSPNQECLFGCHELKNGNLKLDCILMAFMTFFFFFEVFSRGWVSKPSCAVSQDFWLHWWKYLLVWAPWGKMPLKNTTAFVYIWASAECKGIAHYQKQSWCQQCSVWGDKGPPRGAVSWGKHPSPHCCFTLQAAVRQPKLSHPTKPQARTQPLCIKWGLCLTNRCTWPVQAQQAAVGLQAEGSSQRGARALHLTIWAGQ